MLDSYFFAIYNRSMDFSRERIDEVKHTDICLWLDYYGDLLSERQLQVLTYFYADDLSLAEIADLTGLTRQGVHEQVRRGASNTTAAGSEPISCAITAVFVRSPQTFN
jgi:hypothetical protein